MEFASIKYKIAMEIITNALVLRTVDYGENDKILTLLTADCGRITVTAKGVKKAGAKLKFAAQPFCFAQYALAKRGERYTVTGCSECESFYELSADINKFYAASAVAETALALTYEGDDCAVMLSECVRTLTEICAEEECAALLRFLLFSLRRSGYGVALDACPECGNDLSSAEKLRFDMDTGAFTCYDCGDGAGASRVTYHVLRRADGKSYDPDFITTDGYKRALRLLREYCAYKLGAAFKSLSEYIRLL